MLTKAGKALAVALFAGSVAFMAFAIIATRVGDPNWGLAASELKGYDFSQASPDAPWTVKSRGLDGDSGEPIGSGRILPEAVQKAQAHLLGKQTDELTKLGERQTKVAADIVTAKARIEADLKALDKREAQLETEWKNLNTQVTETTKKISDVTKTTKETIDVTNLRYTELVVLRNQLEEVRVQKAAALSEQRRLRDLLYQARGNLERAETRRKSLLLDGAKPDAVYEN